VGAHAGSVEEKAKRLGTLRRHFAHVERYMDAYDVGTLTLAQVEWAMHKYTSHRRALAIDYTDDAFEKLNTNWLSPVTLDEMPDAIKKEKVTADDEQIVLLDDDLRVQYCTVLVECSREKNSLSAPINYSGFERISLEI